MAALKQTPTAGKCGDTGAIKGHSKEARRHIQTAGSPERQNTEDAPL